jgi:hypothetical protein
LGQRRDQGALSQEEFDADKAGALPSKTATTASSSPTGEATAAETKPAAIEQEIGDATRAKREEIVKIERQVQSARDQLADLQGKIARAEREISRPELQRQQPRDSVKTTFNLPRIDLVALEWLANRHVNKTSAMVYAIRLLHQLEQVKAESQGGVHLVIEGPGRRRREIILP